MKRPVLPIDLAFHYLGCAEQREDGRIGVPSRVGPMLQGLSGLVERLSVVAYQPSTTPSFEDGVEYPIDADNVTFVSLGPKSERSDYLTVRRRVRSIVAEASKAWDVILYYQHNRRAHLVYKSARCPRVVGLIGGTMEGAAPPGTPLRERILRRLVLAWTQRQMRNVLREARLGIINSDELLPQVEGVPHIRNVFLSTRFERFTYRTEDRFQSDTINLLVSGRLEPEKGVHDALDAVAILKQDAPNIVLHFAGDGTARAELEQRAHALGLADSVVFHGWIPADERLYDLYRQTDVLLLPSFAEYEGFPGVIWEAMAHSVIVVSTQVRGPRSALRDEEDLLFIPAHQPRAIADAIMRLAGAPDLRKRLIASGFTKAQATGVEDMTSTIVGGIVAAWPELESSSSHL